MRLRMLHIFPQNLQSCVIGVNLTLFVKEIDISKKIKSENKITNTSHTTSTYKIGEQIILF